MQLLRSMLCTMTMDLEVGPVSFQSLQVKVNTAAHSWQTSRLVESLICAFSGPASKLHRVRRTMGTRQLLCRWPHVEEYVMLMGKSDGTVTLEPALFRPHLLFVACSCLESLLSVMTASLDLSHLTALAMVAQHSPELTGHSTLRLCSNLALCW